MCHRIDGKQGAFSNHARDCQNPVDPTRLVANISTSLLTQIEPAGWVDNSLSETGGSDCGFRFESQSRPTSGRNPNELPKVVSHSRFRLH